MWRPYLLLSFCSILNHMYPLCAFYCLNVGRWSCKYALQFTTNKLSALGGTTSQRRVCNKVSALDTTSDCVLSEQSGRACCAHRNQAFSVERAEYLHGMLLSEVACQSCHTDTYNWLNTGWYLMFGLIVWSGLLQYMVAWSYVRDGKHSSVTAP